MLDGMNKLLLAGLGALSLSKEKAEKIFDEYVSRGQAEKAGHDGFVKDLMDAAEKARKDLDAIVEKQVQQAMAKLNLVGREDLERIEAKLDELLNRGQ